MGAITKAEKPHATCIPISHLIPFSVYTSGLPGSGVVESFPNGRRYEILTNSDNAYRAGQSGVSLRRRAAEDVSESPESWTVAKETLFLNPTAAMIPATAPAIARGTRAGTEKMRRWEIEPKRTNPQQGTVNNNIIEDSSL